MVHACAIDRENIKFMRFFYTFTRDEELGECMGGRYR